MCDCHSYNWDKGRRPTITLDPNEYFDWDNEASEISVDACIAEQILALWRAGIWTRGCCCGHNEQDPNVIIDRSEDPAQAISVLESVDPDRSWDVLQWQLVNCSASRA